MKNIFFFIPFIILFASCKKSEKDSTNIPDAAVTIRVSLNNYTSLNVIGNILRCPEDLIGNDRSGKFGYSGSVILFSGFGESAKITAYDRCCTNEECVLKKNKVSADIMPKCDYCGSVFDLTVNGLAVSGKAKYALRNYRVNISGYMLTVARYEY